MTGPAFGLSQPGAWVFQQVSALRVWPSFVHLARPVAGDRIQRVGQSKEQDTGAAGQCEPEEGAEDGVVAVFQYGFDAGLGDPCFVQAGCVARDNPADALPGLVQAPFA